MFPGPQHDTPPGLIPQLRFQNTPGVDSVPPTELSIRFPCTSRLAGIMSFPQPLCTCTCRLPGPTISTVGNTLQIERLGNVKGQSVLCLKGPLTIENVSLFQGAIRREESFSTVILDLSDVPYIDSTALGALVSAYVSRQKLGRRVVLSGASERVSKMLKITSVESLFLTFPTLEDAIGGLTQAGTA